LAGQQQPTDVAMNSPVRRKVLKAPDTEMSTPSPSSRLPQLLCFSFSFCPIRDLRSCSGGRGGAGRVQRDLWRHSTLSCQRAPGNRRTSVDEECQPGVLRMQPIDVGKQH
jgi:hypothetical protein